MTDDQKDNDLNYNSDAEHNTPKSQHIEHGDDILDVDTFMESDAVSDESFDFDDSIQFEEDAYEDIGTQSESTVNWFNIILILIVVVLISGLAYLYLPNILNNQRQASSQSEEMSSSDQIASRDQSLVEKESLNTQQNLATQAIKIDDQSSEGDTESVSGLLFNPDQVSDLNNLQKNLSNEPANDDTRLFDSLDNIVLPENIGQLSEKIPQEDQLQSLPQPADSNISPPVTNDFNDINLVQDGMPQDVTDIENYEQIFVDSSDGNLKEIEATVTVQDSELIIPAQEDVQGNTSSPDPILQAQNPENFQEVDVQNGNSQEVLGVDIEVLSQQIDNINSKINELVTIIESQQMSNETPAQSAIDVSGLERIIEDLNKRLTAIESQTTTSAPSPIHTSVPNIQASVPYELISREKPNFARIKGKSLSQNRSTQNNISNYVAPISAQWELRGAVPGQAYIAESGSPIIRTVRVGDKITEIGHVQSISVENNRWVVRGTQGIITQ